MTDFYVRKSGSDANGGTSASPTPDQTGTDGAITNGLTAFVSLTANFQPGDVGKGIGIDGVGYRVAARVSSSTITLDRAFEASTTSTAVWNLSGCWATFGKVLRSGSPVVGGDTVWIGAGTYREKLIVDMTDPTSEVIVAGDVDGSHTGDAGEIIWSGYDNGDKVLPTSGGPVIGIFTGNHLTFRSITFNTDGLVISTGGVFITNITFTECTYLVWGGIAAIDVAFGTNAAWLFDRCRGFVGVALATISLERGATVDYDANIVFRNCVMYCPQHGVEVASQGSGAKYGGGVIIDACTILCGAGEPMEINIASVSTSIPCRAKNSLLMSGVFGLSATVLGQLVEDYNKILFNSTPLNVSQGAHSIWDNSYAPMFQIGQEAAVGQSLRPFMSPVDGSPFLGFGGSSPPSVDLLNAPRPAGGASPLTAIGALERGNTFVRETGTVRSGANAISVIGPGYQDFDLPVDAAPTTVTAYVRWDATYAGTKPAMAVLNGTECGVADATDTATDSSGAWEQLSLNFTPSAAGIVTIRFISADTNGGGAMFVDDYSVS